MVRLFVRRFFLHSWRGALVVIAFLFSFTIIAVDVPKSVLGKWSAGPSGGWILEKGGLVRGEGILDKASGTYKREGEWIRVSILRGGENLSQKKFSFRFYPFDPKSQKDLLILDEMEREMFYWKDSDGYILDAKEKIKYFRSK